MTVLITEADLAVALSRTPTLDSIARILMPRELMLARAPLLVSKRRLRVLARNGLVGSAQSPLSRFRVDPARDDVSEPPVSPPRRSDG